MWRPFLSAFYEAQAEVVLQSDIGFVGESLSVESIGDGQYTIAGPITANFPGTIELLAALPDASGQLNYFETDSGSVVDGRAAAVLYPSLTTVSDGSTSAVPFTRYVREDDGWHGYSQFTLQRADRLDRQPQLGPRRHQHRSVHGRRPQRHDRRLHAGAR